MNAKRRLFLIPIIVVGCILMMFRYIQVNQHVTNAGVKQEIIIQKNQLVHTSNVNFKIEKYALVPHGNDFQAKITVQLTKTGVSNYGFKKNNDFFTDNMWVDCPYLGNMPTVSNGSNIARLKKDIQNFDQGQTISTNLLFNIPAEMMHAKHHKLYFVFLVPQANQYEKYLLLLDH